MVVAAEDTWKEEVEEASTTLVEIERENHLVLSNLFRLIVRIIAYFYNLHLEAVEQEGMVGAEDLIVGDTLEAGLEEVVIR